MAHKIEQMARGETEMPGWLRWYYQESVLKFTHGLAQLTKGRAEEAKRMWQETLEKEHRILANHENLYQLLEEVYASIAESRGGCLGPLRRCRAAMDEIVRIDASLSGSVNQLQDAFYELEDFAETIRAYKSSIQFDAEKMRATEQRLDLIKTLEKKYGDTIQEVLDYASKCRENLEELENWEEKKRGLEEEIGKLEGELGRRAVELSGKRKKAAARLQAQIEEELQHLGMKKVRFRVLVQTRVDSQEKSRPVINQNGMDIIEFVISPNQGEPFKRLRKIASGGELSRIMLAIKSILAESDRIGALIFDEVDVGIGGEVAVAVGERLRRLSSIKQILCITHLPTIAVHAQNHLRVEKVLKNGRTITKVEEATGSEKIREIARMLSGEAENETALRHAEELLARYGGRG